MALRQGLAAGRDLTNIRIRLLLTGKIEIATQGAHSFPRSKLQREHVAHDVAFDDGNPFPGLQLVIRRRSEIKMFAKR